MLLCPGITGAERNTAANDCVGSQSARFFPLQVHGATASAAITLRQTKDLGECALQHLLNRFVYQVGDVEAVRCNKSNRLRQELVVTAV
ncbi:unannotated protein [freshwater metagenome]|uniref:Unannotated protein n=1 Tax=freshwater metagenome TaxID=449393 RepID=A0A6J6J0S9_9ZZZZ